MYGTTCGTTSATEEYEAGPSEWVPALLGALGSSCDPGDPTSIAWVDAATACGASCDAYPSETDSEFDEWHPEPDLETCEVEVADDDCLYGGASTVWEATLYRTPDSWYEPGECEMTVGDLEDGAIGAVGISGTLDVYSAIADLDGDLEMGTPSGARRILDGPDLLRLAARHGVAVPDEVAALAGTGN